MSRPSKKELKEAADSRLLFLLRSRDRKIAESASDELWRRYPSEYPEPILITGLGTARIGDWDSHD